MSSRSPRSGAKAGPGIDKSQGVVARLFDSVTPTYDRLNRIMSLSADSGWRRAGLRALDASANDLVLDVATGTGDMALGAVRDYDCTVVGLDISRNMMGVADRRRMEEGDQDRYFLVQGDALAMPFKDETFDRAMVAFGVRNMPSLDGFLMEVHRCLKDGGRLVVLELSLPANPVLRPLISLYLTRLLPLFAMTQGGDPAAYRYLTESILTFPPPREVVAAMAANGFKVLSSRPLSFGACHLYVLEKK